MENKLLMANLIKLSFIVPCYNVEQYIAVCLDSLLAQDIPESEYEVICINDCSTDATRDKILEYQRIHSNIILVDHEVNRKLGAARNSGFNIAQGTYIWYVDSDDYIEKNILKMLLAEVEFDELDILNIEFYRLLRDNTICKNKILNSTGLITGKEFIHQLEFWQLNGSVSRKLYKRSFLLDIHLTFSQSGFHEDQIYSLRSVYSANRFRHLETYCYYYRDTPNSLLNTSLTPEKYQSIFQLISDFFTFSNEIKLKDPVLYNSVIKQTLWYLDFAFKQLLFFKNKERKVAIQCFYTDLNTILDSQYFKGWKYLLLSHLKSIHAGLYVISPILRFQKKRKKELKKIWLRIKHSFLFSKINEKV